MQKVESRTGIEKVVSSNNGVKGKALFYKPEEPQFDKENGPAPAVADKLALLGKTINTILTYEGDNQALRFSDDSKSLFADALKEVSIRLDSSDKSLFDITLAVIDELRVSRKNSEVSASKVIELLREDPLINESPVAKEIQRFFDEHIETQLRKHSTGDAETNEQQQQANTWAMVTETMLQDMCRRSKETAYDFNLTTSEAINQTMTKFAIDKLGSKSMNHKYQKDILYARDEILRTIAGLENFEEFLENSPHPEKVIFADHLSPDDVMAIAKYNTSSTSGRVTACILKDLAENDHTANFAKIPLVRLDYAPLLGSKAIRAGSEVLIFDNEDRLVINPSQATLAEFEARTNRSWLERKEIPPSLHKPLLHNGDRVNLHIAIDPPNEAGAEFAPLNIGLVRAEGYILSKPEILANLEGSITKVLTELSTKHPTQTITIRAFDISEDKSCPALLEYLGYKPEDKPFTDVNGSRLLLQHADKLLRPFIRAVLKAGAKHDNLKILFPKVLDQFVMKKLSEIVADEKTKLQKDKVRIQSSLKIGAMIETASAIYSLEQISQYVDFFNIGTTDLSHAILGATRGSKGTKIFPGVPAVIGALKDIRTRLNKINESRGEDNKLSAVVCGVFANDPNLVSILIGLGYRSLCAGTEKAFGINYALATCIPAACSEHTELALRHDFENMETYRAFINDFRSSQTLNPDLQRAFGAAA